MKVIKRDPNTAYIDNWFWVPKQYVNVEGTKSALTFTFSDSFTQHHRFVYLWKETEHHLLVPRAFWDARGMPYRVVDLRPSSYPQTSVTSKIKLDHRWHVENGQQTLKATGSSVQQKSLDAMLHATGGILQLACGKGKTCVALELIARTKVPALVVVPDTTLLEQWQREINMLLDVPGGIGLIQADVFRWRHPIVMTTYHTIGARAPLLSEEVLRWFGLIIWDEGHHIPAPTFEASAEAFYGRRFALTATPRRDDGLHIISEYHIGPIVYQDLSQDLKPIVVFKWTGLKPDMAKVGPQILDKNQQLHLGKLSGYFGRWPERIKLLLDDVAMAIQNGRRVLVLSNSEGEIINLAALWDSGNWTNNTTTALFTDIPLPSPTEVGETIMPVAMTEVEANRKRKFIERTQLKLQDSSLTQKMRDKLQYEINGVENLLKQYEVYKKIRVEFGRRQMKYVRDLLLRIKRCGLMVHKVPAKTRLKFVEEKQVVFAIVKYGKESLDSPALDTILVSTPFSSRNGLQQVMGRPSRVYFGKKAPLVIFYEDELGLLIGMCQKLKKHLRDWPLEEGGPFEYEHINHPKLTRQSCTMQTIFGR
jgi:superfamily II DNA or RNA helicase